MFKTGDIYEQEIINENGIVEIKQFRVVDAQEQIKEDGTIIFIVVSEPVT